MEDIIKLAKREAKRQKNSLTLIASESLIYFEALPLLKLPLFDKYSEGYPGRRFYGGCKYIDQIETAAIDAATALFNCRFANVQCYSGSIANLAIYRALLNPGDVILGMEMSAGGHLTHGSPHSCVSHYYRIHSYSLDPKTLRIDYGEVRRLALEIKPKLIIAGGSSYPFRLDFAAFRAIADEVGAYLLADICHLSGLVATGLHSHCFPHAHVAMCTTHKQLRGYRGAVILWNDEELTAPINRAVFPGVQGGMNASAVAANALCMQKNLSPSYSEYMASVLKNAKTMCDHFRDKGVEVLGTETHLFLVNTKISFRLSGREAADLLEEAGYITNPNLVPFDVEGPFVTSGIRIGTLCLSLLHPTEQEVRWMVDQICDILSSRSRVFARRAGRELRAWLNGKHRHEKDG